MATTKTAVTDTDAAAAADTAETPATPAFNLDALLGATVYADMDAVQAAWKEKTVRTPKGTASITDTPYYQIVKAYATERPLPNGQTYKVGHLVQIPWAAMASLPSMQPNAAVAKRERADRPHERTYKMLALAAAALTPAMYPDTVTDTERSKAGALIAPDTCAFTLIPLSDYTARVEARRAARAAAKAAKAAAATDTDAPAETPSA
jgi:hypothetical protein